MQEPTQENRPLPKPKPDPKGNSSQSPRETDGHEGKDSGNQKKTNKKDLLKEVNSGSQDLECRLLHNDEEVKF